MMEVLKLLLSDNINCVHITIQDVLILPFM